MKFRKFIYNVLGILAVALAAIGAVLPLLPTTPFLLLALWLFSRGSPRLRRWLLTNRLFGRYLRDYAAGRGLTVAAKAWVLMVLWFAIGWSAYCVNKLWVTLLLAAVAVGVTIHILSLKTKRRCLPESLSSPRRRLK